ncbi:uncharacterized protein LOC132538628 [Erinaceus europaeus]|uniref:Uncharacterized protein LOC132538628 n=1 Tax=Erinaceus europaeus TaxID=9365 RepID=A0ABM3XF34_ERIEU|nr:uncharacterized protein LOC132538628 [Erinaceus europaeus]
METYMPPLPSAASSSISRLPPEASRHGKAPYLGPGGQRWPKEMARRPPFRGSRAQPCGVLCVAVCWPRRGEVAVGSAGWARRHRGEEGGLARKVKGGGSGDLQAAPRGCPALTPRLRSSSRGRRITDCPHPRPHPPSQPRLALTHALWGAEGLGSGSCSCGALGCCCCCRRRRGHSHPISLPPARLEAPEAAWSPAQHVTWSLRAAAPSRLAVALPGMRPPRPAEPEQPGRGAAR